MQFRIIFNRLSYLNRIWFITFSNNGVALLKQAILNYLRIPGNITLLVLKFD